MSATYWHLIKGGRMRSCSLYRETHVVILQQQDASPLIPSNEFGKSLVRHKLDSRLTAIMVVFLWLKHMKEDGWSLKDRVDYL